MTRCVSFSCTLSERQFIIEKMLELYLPTIGNEDHFFNPHITLGYFLGSEKNMAAWHEFVKTLEPFTGIITLDRLAKFSNNALVLLPDDNSRQLLKEYSRQLNSSLPFSFFNRPHYPHLTLERNTNVVLAEPISLFEPIILPNLTLKLLSK